jgi:hypothetical protein
VVRAYLPGHKGLGKVQILFFLDVFPTHHPSAWENIRNKPPHHFRGVSSPATILAPGCGAACNC